jgi:hypothetical protein
MERDEEEIRLVVDTNVLISALPKRRFFDRQASENQCLLLLLYMGRPYGNRLLSRILVSKRAKYIQASSFEHALQFVLGSVSIVPSEMYLITQSH